LKLAAKSGKGGKSSEGADGGIEEPLEAGEPSWAPKCAADYKPETQKPKPAVNAASPPANCIDTNEVCPFWQSRGWCKKAPEYMKKHCQGACDAGCAKKFIQFDAGECIDKRPECKDFVAAGHCARTPFFMIWQCPLACQFCLATPPFVYEYTTADFTCRAA